MFHTSYTSKSLSVTLQHIYFLSHLFFIYTFDNFWMLNIIREISLEETFYEKFGCSALLYLQL